jgi:hypothetical protein
LADLPQRADQLRALVDRAEAGGHGAVDELRAYLRGDPAAADVVLRAVPSQLELWVRRRAGKSGVRLAATWQLVDALRSGLAGDAPSALEQLLVDRTVVCWLALDVAEVSYLQGTEEGHDRKAEEFWLRRVDGSQRRLLQAVKALALVRRMPPPAIWAQVAQIGQQQLNVTKVD